MEFFPFIQSNWAIFTSIFPKESNWGTTYNSEIFILISQDSQCYITWIQNRVVRLCLQEILIIPSWQVVILAIFDTYGKRLYFSMVPAGLLQFGTHLHKPVGFHRGLHCPSEVHRDHTGNLQNSSVDQLLSGTSGMDHLGLWSDHSMHCFGLCVFHHQCSLEYGHHLVST